MKNIRIFHLKIFIFFGGKSFSIFGKACFRNDKMWHLTVCEISVSLSFLKPVKFPLASRS